MYSPVEVFSFFDKLFFIFAPSFFELIFLQVNVDIVTLLQLYGAIANADFLMQTSNVFV